MPPALPARLTLALLLTALPLAAHARGPVRGVEPPPGAVVLSPGDDIQQAVDARPAGTTFFLSKGTYRLQGISPKNRDVFVGAYGAVLSGAKLLTQFERAGALWVAYGQPIDPEAIVHGECTPKFPRCDHPQDLYIDGRPLRAVAKKSHVEPGTFFYDYPNEAVYFADDPSGRTVELSYRAYAFVGDANDVTVRNLVIEKYAAADQRGAINNPTGKRWSVLDNDVRWNHGYGVVSGSNDVVMRNIIRRNGQIGVGGGGVDGVRVEDNEIAFNVWNGTSCDWECGGAKWGAVTNLTVRNNHVHDNGGTGLWTDVDCTGILYEGNLVENNRLAGISHEISGGAVIRNNTLRYNGARTFGWGWNGQIQIQNSTDTEVYGNTAVLHPDKGGNGIMIIQQNRGASHMPRNNRVHDNDVTMAGGDGAVAGWFADFKPGQFKDSENLFDNNRYHVRPTGPGVTVWAPNDWVSFETWQATGQDVNSTRDGDLIPPP